MRNRAALRLLGNGVVRYLGQLTALVCFGMFEGPEALGYFTLALAYVTPLFALTSFGIRQLVLTYSTAVTPGDYEMLRGLSGVLLTALVGVSALVLVPNVFPVVFVVSIFKALEGVFDVYQGLLVRNEREHAVLKWGWSLTLLQVGVFGLGILSGGSIVLALMLSYGAYALFLFGRVRPDVIDEAIGTALSRMQLSRLRGIAFVGFPLGVSLFLLSLLTVLPQWLLGAFGSVADAGRFAVLSYSIVAMEMILVALSQAWIGTAREFDERGTLGLWQTIRIASVWQMFCLPVFILAVVCILVVAPSVFGAVHETRLIEVLPLVCAGVSMPFLYASANALLVKNRYKASLLGSVTALFASASLGVFFVMYSGPFQLSHALWCFAVGVVLRAIWNFGVFSESVWNERRAGEREMP